MDHVISKFAELVWQRILRLVFLLLLCQGLSTPQEQVPSGRQDNALVPFDARGDEVGEDQLVSFEEPSADV